MKILLFIILIIVSQQGYTCSCATQPPLNKLSNSEFVATVKVLNVSQDLQNKHYQDVEFEIIDLYKGDNISTLKNYGGQESMCGIHTPEDSTWLIYAYRSNDGYLRQDLCSGSKQIDKIVNYDTGAQKRYDNYIKSNLNLLNYLKDEDIRINNKHRLQTYIFGNCLDDFNGVKVEKQRFALYELTVDNDLNIKMVDALIEFDNNVQNQDLLNCVDNNIQVHKKIKALDIPENTKVIFGLYYNPANEDTDSFISQHYLGY